MENQEITPQDLERFAAELAQAIPDLDCPECCDTGWKYQYMEMSAALFREEWEWHCLIIAVQDYHSRHRSH